MTTAGVGAVVDLPGMSVIVRGLDAWGAGGMPISEPRLLAEVGSALPAAGVTSLRAAPSTRQPADDPYTPRRRPGHHRSRAGCGAPPATSCCPSTASTSSSSSTARAAAPTWPSGCIGTARRQAQSRRRSAGRASRPASSSPARADTSTSSPTSTSSTRPRSGRVPGPQLEIRDAGSVLGPRVTVELHRRCGCAAATSRAPPAQGCGEPAPLPGAPPAPADLRAVRPSRSSSWCSARPTCGSA